MKKANLNTKTLALTTETLRTLQPHELSDVDGGAGSAVLCTFGCQMSRNNCTNSIVGVCTGAK